MKLYRIKILFILSVGLIFYSSFAQANCKDPELKKQVTQTAKAEGVDENELLSIIAHESACHYYTIAWNIPGKAYSAKSKFLNSLEEAKDLAESLISTKKYRVDVGIGQINNEAHIQPKGWSLEEVLNPKTALNRVAKILKKIGWAHYHSSNPDLAVKWQTLAFAALNSAFGKVNLSNKMFIQLKAIKSLRNVSNLLVYNAGTSTIDIINSHMNKSSLLITINRNNDILTQ